MNRKITWLTLFLAVSGFSFAQHKNAAATKRSPIVHYGVASYYANKFDGRRMANGEFFSQKKMTAASNLISLNNWVRVTNLRNKKNVVVKITDRMHPNNKRLIDLSHGAAKKLDYLKRGLVRVKVEVLGKRRPAGWVAEE